MPCVRLALMIEGQEGVTWEDWLALARACEEHGVEALFRSDHYLSPTDPARPALDAWAILSALAARTERIELGTLVSPVTFRPAAVLANQSATAFEISGGRVTLGMGTGWMEAEHEAFGFPFPPMEERLALLREQIPAVQGFWGDGERPRLVVGGSGLSGTVGPAARWADEYNTIMAPPNECARRRQKLARACAREGRAPIPLSLMTACAIGRDAAEARQRISRRLERAGQGHADPDEYRAARGEAAVLGTLDEAAAQLRRYEEAGVERVMLQHLDHTDLAMVELIGRELAPKFAAQVADPPSGSATRENP
jgi:alkanesulfonate monooxygenase SsuD/methylene tetrahydromethanopterin reductase-like flavin-dependent oxidoreductase (luciferase family)